MNHSCNAPAQKNNSALTRALLLLPAVALGMFAMITSGTSAMIWGQQAAAFLLFTLLSLLGRAAKKVPSRVCLLLLTVSLAATLLFPAVDGARRWLDLGPLNINAAMLALPALLLLCCNQKLPYPLLILVTGVLCLQPDLSQLAAFTLGSLPLLFQRRRDQHWLLLSLIAMAAFALGCMFTPVTLEPVAYCEGIITLLGAVSPLLMIVGWMALLLIPGYFAYRFFKIRALPMLCLSIYYAVTLLFSLTGEYPVPFMGFGLSPLAGYCLASLLISSLCE